MYKGQPTESLPTAFAVGGPSRLAGVPRGTFVAESGEALPGVVSVGGRSGARVAPTSWTLINPESEESLPGVLPAASLTVGPPDTAPGYFQPIFYPDSLPYQISAVPEVDNPAGGTAHEVLHGGGAGFEPVDLTADVENTLPIVNGGTNSATALNNHQLMVSAGGKIVELGAATNGQIPIGSTGASPSLALPTGTASQIVVTPSAGGLNFGLASVGANGTFTNPSSMTVDQQGRVTAATSGTSQTLPFILNFAAGNNFALDGATVNNTIIIGPQSTRIQNGGTAGATDTGWLVGVNTAIGHIRVNTSATNVPNPGDTATFTLYESLDSGISWAGVAGGSFSYALDSLITKTVAISYTLVAGREYCVGWHVNGAAKYGGAIAVSVY